MFRPLATNGIVFSLQLAFSRWDLYYQGYKNN